MPRMCVISHTYTFAIFTVSENIVRLTNAMALLAPGFEDTNSQHLARTKPRRNNLFSSSNAIMAKMANLRRAQTVERVHYRDLVESARQVDKGEGKLVRCYAAARRTILWKQQFITLNSHASIQVRTTQADFFFLRPALVSLIIFPLIEPILLRSWDDLLRITDRS